MSQKIVDSTGPNGEKIRLYVNVTTQQVTKAEEIKSNNSKIVLSNTDPKFSKAIENANSNNATRTALGLGSKNLSASPTYQKDNQQTLSANGISQSTDELPPNAQGEQSALSAVGASLGLPNLSLEEFNKQFGGNYNPIFKETLVYPTDLSKNQDRMQITMYRYRTSGLLARSNSPREPGEILGCVVLPMPSQLKDVSEVKWATNTVSSYEIAAGVLGMAGRILKSNAVESGRVDPTQATDAKNQNIGKGVSADQLSSRFLGVISNPNQDLLFDGIGLRQFTYNFILVPRNQDESKTIRKIVRTFRQGMLPRKISAGLIIGAPNTFRIKFIQGGTNKPLKDVRRHKEMALVNFVAYPMLTDAWMTYDDNDHSALGFKIEMTFQELTPVYYNDFTDNNGKDINEDPIDESNENISVGY